MQIIYKADTVFLWIYSAIILIIGIVGAVSVGSILFLLIMIGVEMIYLSFALRRPFRRFRALKQEFPAQWKRFLAEYSTFYRSIDEEGKKRFERDVRIFLSDFSVKGTRGSTVDIETRLLVASGVAALLHGRPDWEAPIRDGVVVFPGERFNRNYQPGRGSFAGMATQRGPLLLTEGSLEESFKHPHDGYNVMYHELAHYFDLESGSSEWKSLFMKEWEKMSRGQDYTYLRPYALTNEAEFFAVATESFFENPWEMRARSPRLYNALKEFFNLDTAEMLKES